LVDEQTRPNCYMKTKALKLAVALFAASAVLSSCKKEKEITENPIGVNYDKILEDALTSASDGIGIAHYLLPDDGQYHLIPQDPTNPINHAKIALGRMLYHESGIAINPRMSQGTGTMSCASCHHAQGGFQANMRQGIGEGGVGFGSSGEGRKANPSYPIDSVDVQPLRTPTVLNCAYQKVMLWNGQFGATGPNAGTESNWTPGTPIATNQLGHEGVEIQAIAGLGVHRMDVTADVCETYQEYEQLFDICFPEFPIETRYSKRTAGLAVAAYERTLVANQAPFQHWLRGESNALSDSEKRGGALFFGKAECGSCHNGPALNSMSFHALGMDDLVGENVLRSNPNDPAHKGRASFTHDPADEYKFKTPQLYNLMDSKFFGHGGSFRTVREVVEYKNDGVATNFNVPASQLAEEFQPLHLTDEEITDIVNFIENGLYDNNLMRYTPNALPSGNCFPNNDVLSQIDQGCIQ